MRVLKSVGFLLAITATASTAALQTSTNPPAIDEVALHWAARAAIARGVASLKLACANDQDGWVAPPYRRQKVVGKTNVVVRYSERKGPLYEYEKYTAYERAPGASAADAQALKPVTRIRVKRLIDPVGRTILVPDRNGPIERSETRPVCEKGGDDQWSYGLLGINGMALYTLRRCGLPEEDEAVQRLRGRLVDFVQKYGAPDQTWDVAWLAAAFSTLTDPESVTATGAMASKLLDGQVLDGDARGLWGPVSVHIPLLAAVMQCQQDAIQKLLKAQAALKEKPEMQSRQKEVDKAEKELATAQKAVRGVSMLAPAIDNVDGGGVKLSDDVNPTILVPGAAHYLFNQTTADLDCTFVALMGLREAARAGRLPPQTTRPALESSGAMPIPPPEKADAVLARTINALARLQSKETGGWTEGNFHQPVNNFDKLGKQIPGIPVDAKTFQPLPSPETPASCLAGYNAMLEASEAVGLQNAFARFRDSILQGRGRALAAWASTTNKPPAGQKPPPPPMGYLRSLPAGVATPPGSRLQDQRSYWVRTALDLLLSQKANGTWLEGVVGRDPTVSSSLRARMNTLEKLDRKNPEKVSAMNRAAAHVRANWFLDGPSRLWTVPTNSFTAATCYGLLALSEFVRPPAIVAQWKTSGPAQLAQGTLDDLAIRNGVDWSYVVRDFPLSFAKIDASPLLFLEGSGALSLDPATAAALKGFLRGGGLVIACAHAGPEGDAFLDSVAGALSKAEGIKRPDDISTDDRILGDFAGKLGRPLHGLRRDDGSLAAVLVPLSDTGTTTTAAFTVPQAVRLAGRMIERSLDSAFLAPDYACNLGSLGEPDIVFADAMRYLKGAAQRETASVEEEETVAAPDSDGGSESQAPEPAAPPEASPTPAPPAADEKL